MSDGPIKPEDLVSEMLRGHRLSADFIAAMLNSAIECGVVSPPCHYIQHENGWRPNVNGKLRIWPGKPEPGFAQYRHWKGEE